MNIIQYSPEVIRAKTALNISQKATELIEKFHNSEDGLSLKNWKILSEILDYAAAAEQTIAEQKEYISSLESMTSSDILTGLYNRHGFDNELTNAIARAQRHQESGLFAYIDLDNFKFINDNYGHNAGDAVLKHIGKLLKQSIRKTDAAARLGGDEFGLLLNNCDTHLAREKAGYIRHSLKKITIKYNDIKLYTGASMGFADISSKSTLGELYEKADQEMYKNKNVRKRTKNKYHLT